MEKYFKCHKHKIYIVWYKQKSVQQKASFLFLSVRESTIIVHFGDFFSLYAISRKIVMYTYINEGDLELQTLSPSQEWSIVLSYCSNFLGWLYKFYQGLNMKLWILTSLKDKIKSKLGNCYLIVNTNKQVLLRLYVMIHRNDRLSKQSHSDSEP